VGGVGSGKSAVVRALGGVHLHVIDADSIGHQQLLIPGVHQKLVQQFGQQITNAAGEIDRPKLAALVFGDSPEQQQAREQLNHIVRPGIRCEILKQLENIPPDATAVILDAALLLEAGWQQLCDAVIFIDTPVAVRQQRVAAARGWSSTELSRREASQWPLDRKRAASSYVIDNSTSLSAAATQLRLILNQIVNQPAQSHR
jgi:dephospho-CoA kinase